jgi:hypothetical protein
MAWEGEPALPDGYRIPTERACTVRAGVEDSSQVDEVIVWLQVAVDPVSLLHAPQTRPGIFCASSMLPLLASQISILSLYYTRLITPEQNLHISAPLRTCSGIWHGFRGIQQFPYSADKVHAFCRNDRCLSTVLSIFYQQLGLDSTVSFP